MIHQAHGWFFVFHVYDCGQHHQVVFFLLPLPCLVLFHFRQKLDALQRVYINFLLLLLLLLLSNLLELPPLELYGIAERTFTQLYSLLGCSSHRVMQHLNATRNMRVCNQVLSPYSFWSTSMCAFIFFSILCSCQYFLCSVVTIFDLVHIYYSFPLKYIIK